MPKSHQKGVDWVAKVMCSVGSSTTFVVMARVCGFGFRTRFKKLLNWLSLLCWFLKCYLWDKEIPLISNLSTVPREWTDQIPCQSCGSNGCQYEAREFCLDKGQFTPRYYAYMQSVSKEKLIHTSFPNIFDWYHSCYGKWCCWWTVAVLHTYWG